MSDEKHVDETSGIETTGHVWDGIRELNNPLPRWWLYLFWATVIWAVVYWVLFPAIPLINQATPGLLAYSSRANVERELDELAASRASLDEKIGALSFDDIMVDPALADYARRSGASAFKIVCVQCHGSGAAGSQELGYPNLNDDAWLWGGTTDAIYQTIAHGVRNDEAESRQSQMPAFGVIGALDNRQIHDVANTVRAMAGLDHDAEAAEAGQETYATQCAVCHGAGGEGNIDLGAPRLNDAIWLYGSSLDQIAAQVRDPRMGVMPPWHEHFDEPTLKKLAIYIHSLGGGQ
ncbi:MAG: cytochrome-c oxidase, cbb3-type subunit III [Acuticoccus sp.]